MAASDALVLLCAGSFSLALAGKLALRRLLGVDAGRQWGNELTAVFAPFLFAVVVYHACRVRELDGTRAGRAILRLGIESYSLYLSHPITIALWIWVTTALSIVGRGLAGLACLPLALIGSSIFYQLFEKRFVLLSAKLARNRLGLSPAPRRTGGLPARDRPQLGAKPCLRNKA